MKAIKILWLSRHSLTNESIEDLKRIYGEMLEIFPYTNSVLSSEEIIEIGKDCDILAVVLPPAILKDLVDSRKNTKPIIRAKANRVETGWMIISPTGEEEKEFKFVHAGWEQILKFEIITKEL